jgi:negative regulator of flagellin synthesis FlgM
MGIEISGSNGRPAQDATEAAKSQSAQPAGDTSTPAAAVTKPGSSSNDRVELSNQASQLKALEAEISSLPVVDTQRVKDVQHTLATGSFQVEPAKVADKMLRFEAGLGES